MGTMTKTGKSARMNAIISLCAIIGILVVINIISGFLFGKIDLTENKRYTLSDVSIEAVRALDSLDVQVFISKDLPSTITVGFGQEKDIRGVDRAFLDKLEEYQSYSQGRMKISIVSDDIEEKASKAKLELFTGKKAEVEGGRLEFKKYALGATFQYRTEMEVFPLAIEPEYYEFEITKILLRLKERYEKSSSMKDILEAGKSLAESAKTCNEKIKSFEKEGEQGGGALGALMGSKDMVSSMMMNKNDIIKACNDLPNSIARASQMAGKHENLDQLVETTKSFQETVNEIIKLLDDKDAKPGQISALVEKLHDIYEAVDKDHTTLKESPGRKSIGFICGHREFCPFASDKPLIRPELAGLMGQRNPLVQQFVNQAKQIEDQINMINEQIKRGIFTRRGLSVKRIDPGDPIPDDVEVIVLYGPEKPLSDRDMYEIDQFLLAGHSVIVFLNNWDIALYNIRKGGDSFDFSEMTMDEIHRKKQEHNLDAFLEHYGVKIHHDLILETKAFEPITIIHVQKQGQFTLQSQREFPYPLLPTFSELDRTHVLVRRLANITLPFVSSLEVTDAARATPGMEITELIKSSSSSISMNEGLKDEDLSPPILLRKLVLLQPNGPHTVAAVLKGPFRSYFDGKPIPPRPEKKDDDEFPRPKVIDRPFKASGSGRLLVIGSNLGLENLSPEKVFEDFNMGMLSSGTADFFMKLKDYIANFQNWQLRLSQIAPIIQANLDFLFNCLDWGIQKEALVDIRSKGLVKRPIDTISEGGQAIIKLGFIIGLPLVFIAFGIVRWTIRNR